MSWTLFKYIFRDLLRIFLVTSGALAGIMSFGGLLRPLTKHGLDAAQVGAMLSYLTPAMTAYSYPVAALFATTVVYGRLSADNEMTACRAAGISHLAIALPAFVLGLLVALVSLIFLCFVVPTFTLKVERVIYANIAQLVANQIQRTHQIGMPGSSFTIYAQEAHVLSSPEGSGAQIVELIGPMIVMDDKGKVQPGLRIPKSFYMARSATAYFRELEGGDRFELMVRLEGGLQFARKPEGQIRGGIQTTQFGPIVLPSPIKENTKFMDIRRLKELYRDRDKSRRIRNALDEFSQKEQEQLYLQQIAEALATPGGRFVARSEDGTDYMISAAAGSVQRVPGALIVGAAGGRSGDVDAVKGVGFRVSRAGSMILDAESAEAKVKAVPDAEAGVVVVSVELRDAVLRTDDLPTPRASYLRSFVVPMPDSLRAVEFTSAEQALQSADLSGANRQRLVKEMIGLENGLIAEMNARASFSVSCFLLVLVGCALGMMFRSGNFLTAFAISFVPALLSITLIVSGQHTAENVPWNITDSSQSKLDLGLAVMWSANVINGLLAAVMLGRLQRK